MSPIDTYKDNLKDLASKQQQTNIKHIFKKKPTSFEEDSDVYINNA